MSIESTMILSEPTELDQCDRFQDETPPLTMEQMFYPLGFPLRVRTNSEEVLRQCAIKWGVFAPRTHQQPIEADIHVIEDDSIECPPLPKWHFMGNVLVMAADARNLCTVNFPWGKTHMVLSTGALKHHHYLSQTFLETVPACQLLTRFVTSIHAACVVLDGHGVLLCGDSGAGKTSLSYACTRAGWQFVSDDTSYIPFSESERRVVGDFHQVRFRPSAVELFPELAHAEITPRMFGKPSIELPTASMRHVSTAESAHVDFIVFLDRHHSGCVDLAPYNKDAARRHMRKVLFGTPETKTIRYAAIERLLTAGVLELRYQSLDQAVQRLKQLVREGC